MARPQAPIETIGRLPVDNIRGVAAEWFLEDEATRIYEGDDASFRLAPIGDGESHAVIDWHGDREGVHTSQSAGYSIRDNEACPINGLSEEAIVALRGLDLTNVYERISLPFDNIEQQFLEALAEHQVIIVVGDTGTGKSTRSTTAIMRQFLAGKTHIEELHLTQPRVAASENLYNRIHDEVKWEFGEEVANRHVRLRTANQHGGPDDAFAGLFTDGYEHVAQLSTMNLNGSLNNTAVILDEVHEGNNNVVAHAAFLHMALPKNPDMRVVVMSATADSHLWSNYFAQVISSIPPIISIKGRQHKLHRIEDPDLTVVQRSLLCAEEILDGNDPLNNAVLTFLDGKQSIKDTYQALSSRMSPAMRKEAIILPLHAKMPQRDQQAALRYFPGKRLRLIPATNVAQTSVTIPGVRFVVDGAYAKHKEMDELGYEGLVLFPISQADCDQRAGRGR